jgi:hypothetical protein
MNWRDCSRQQVTCGSSRNAWSRFGTERSPTWRRRPKLSSAGIKAIPQRIDRLDNAFLYEQSIDIETYDRHAEKLREELTLARIDGRSGQLDELDVEGILAFAERILPRAADLWVQASLDQRQRFQQLFFPDGISFDGNRFVGTGATAPAFSYLREIETEKESLACQPKLRGERSAVRLRQRLRRTTFARVP